MEILRKLREERGISQETLAKMCGMSRVAISNLERGKTVDVKLSTLRTFSRVLNVPMSIFIS